MSKESVQFSSVQYSVVPNFVTPWTAAHQASLSITNSRILKLMSKESVMPSNHLILCHSLLLPPSIFPGVRVFSNELLLCIRWPKYWNKQAIYTYTYMYICYIYIINGKLLCRSFFTIKEKAISKPPTKSSSPIEVWKVKSLYDTKYLIGLE